MDLLSQLIIQVKGSFKGDIGHIIGQNSGYQKGFFEGDIGIGPYKG